MNVSSLPSTCSPLAAARARAGLGVLHECRTRARFLRASGSPQHCAAAAAERGVVAASACVWHALHTRSRHPPPRLRCANAFYARRSRSRHSRARRSRSTLSRTTPFRASRSAWRRRRASRRRSSASSLAGSRCRTTRRRVSTTLRGASHASCRPPPPPPMSLRSTHDWCLRVLLSCVQWFGAAPRARAARRLLSASAALR